MSKKQTLYFEDTSKGFNIVDQPYALSDEVLVDSIDCEPGFEGVMKARIPYDNTLITANGILAIFVWNNEVYTIDAEKYMKVNGVTKDTLAYADTLSMFIGHFNGKIYYTGGDKILRSYTISGGAVAAVKTFSNPVIASAIFQNRIFISCIGDNGRIFYSPYNTDTDFDDYVDLPEVSNVTAMVTTNNGIYIGCGSNKIYMLTGRSALSFSIQMATSGRTFAVQGAFSWNNTVVFEDLYDKELYIWDGYNIPKRFGDKNLIDRTSNSSGIDIKAMIYKDYYIMGAQSSISSHTPNTLFVYDLSRINDGVVPCSKWKIPNISTPMYNGYFVRYGTHICKFRDTDNNTWLDKYDKPDGVNYVPIKPSCRSRASHVGTLNRDKRGLRVHLATQGTADYDITLISTGGVNDCSATQSVVCGPDYDGFSPSVKDINFNSQNLYGRNLAYEIKTTDVAAYPVRILGSGFTTPFGYNADKSRFFNATAIYSTSTYAVLHSLDLSAYTNIRWLSAYQNRDIHYFLGTVSGPAYKIYSLTLSTGAIAEVKELPERYYHASFAGLLSSDGLYIVYQTYADYTKSIVYTISTDTFGSATTAQVPFPSLRKRTGAAYYSYNLTTGKVYKTTLPGLTETEVSYTPSGITGATRYLGVTTGYVTVRDDSNVFIYDEDLSLIRTITGIQQTFISRLSTDLVAPVTSEHTLSYNLDTNTYITPEVYKYTSVITSFLDYNGTVKCISGGYVCDFDADVMTEAGTVINAIGIEIDAEAS